MSKMKYLVKRASAGIRSEICHPTEGYKAVFPMGANWRNAKYEILNDAEHRIMIGDTRYQRIRALRRIERPFGLPPVEPGDLGGYVAIDTVPYGDCLSNDGDCWIADEAFVSGYISGDSQVTGHAHVGYPSEVSGKSLISDFAQVIDGAGVYDSMVTDYAQVVGRNLEGLDSELVCWSRKQTEVSNHSWISGRARVSDGAFIIRFSHVGGSAVVGGYVQLRKGASVTGGVTLMSERAFVDLSGEVIDEPMNMWGFPTVLVTHADGEGGMHTAESFGGDAYGAVLPYIKAEYTVGTSAAHKIADIYGVELEPGDGGDTAICVSSYDKDAGYPRPVHVSPVTGIAYLERPTKEEYEEFEDNLDEIVKQGREKRYKGRKFPRRTPEQEKAYRAQSKEVNNKADLVYWERQLRRYESEGKKTETIEHIIKNIKSEMNTEESSNT